MTFSNSATSQPSLVMPSRKFSAMSIEYGSVLVTMATFFFLGVHLPDCWMRSSRPTRLGP